MFIFGTRDETNMAAIFDKGVSGLAPEKWLCTDGTLNDQPCYEDVGI